MALATEIYQCDLRYAQSGTMQRYDNTRDDDSNQKLSFGYVKYQIPMPRVIQCNLFDLFFSLVFLECSETRIKKRSNLLLEHVFARLDLYADVSHSFEFIDFRKHVFVSRFFRVTFCLASIRLYTTATQHLSF